MVRSGTSAFIRVYDITYFIVCQGFSHDFKKNFKNLPSFNIILLEFFIARSFIIALKNIVSPAMSAETEIDINIIEVLLEIFFVSIDTMATPPAPQSVLQISPTTSAQKEQTFSELLQSFSPAVAPLTPDFFHSTKTSASDVAAAIPIISNKTDKNMKIKIIKVAIITPVVEINISLINPKIEDIKSVTINILPAQKYFFAPEND